MANRKKASAEAETAVSAAFDYAAEMNAVERKFNMTNQTLDQEATAQSVVSTGTLVTDLILSGGIRPGLMYTWFGGEGSAKSTQISTLKIMCAKAGVPLLSDFDYEGSSDAAYIEGILEYTYGKRYRFQDIFGLRDNKGEWLVKPLVRPYNASNAEDFFDPMSALLRRLPNKEYISKEWFLVFEADKRGRALAGKGYSKALYSKTGKLYIPAPNGLPQLIMFVDSLPVMFPGKLDEDDKGAGMAAVARAMAENLPRIGSKLRPKAATLVAVNQLRLRPGFNMGDPSYEPAGEAVKFWSSTRIRQTARSVPHGKGPLEKEESVLFEGARDTYRYMMAKNIKNKASTPYLTGWYRIWVNDSTKQAHGFCPVWDTFQYLKTTGQATGTMKKMSIPLITKRPIEWKQFKSLILLRGEQLKKTLKGLGLKEDPKLRQKCFAQFKKGDAIDMHLNYLKTVDKE